MALPPSSLLDAKPGQAQRTQFDAIVVGSGPNGLAAAVAIARAGHSVVVYEAESEIGGGTRSAELTLPGFIHDICSSVHPMGASSPFFNELGLDRFGLRWVQPDAALAHPLENGDAAVLTRSFADDVAQFGQDAGAVRDWLGPFIESWSSISQDVLGPLGLPKHVAAMARFGWNALQPTTWTAAKLKTDKARAVLAGMAGHSMLPFDRWGTSGVAIVLWTACYTAGWPFAAGGSQSIANALAGLLKSLGGEIVTGHRILGLDELPPARAVLCDITPRQFLKIGGVKIQANERRQLEKYRYGPGVFKIDWALDAPIPWNADTCRRAGTVHVGGTFEEIAASELAAWNGEHAERPFVLVAQPSLFDPSRAPHGKYTAWGYCHVPNGSTMDMQERIEAQIERFANGFRKRILARSVMGPRNFEVHNANLIGGDIGAGSMEIAQLFTRPTYHMYSTSIANTFLCSASTPPGPGVHGMCGYHAAKRALHKCF